MVKRKDDRHEEEKNDDQQIYLARAMAFRSAIGIEIVFIQTHKVYTVETCCFTWPAIIIRFLYRNFGKACKVSQPNKKNATVAQNPPNPAIRNNTGLLTPRSFSLWFPRQMFRDFILASSTLWHQSNASVWQRFGRRTLAILDWFIWLQVSRLKSE